MIATFYGVRGSIPAPGPTTVKYGGNTSCVYLELASGTDIILDAGTGIRALGTRLERTDTALCLLLSHRHWDHIQGFPFFTPIYQKGREIRVFAGVEDSGSLLSVLEQMDGATFPVHAKDLPSRIERFYAPDVPRELDNDQVKVLVKPLNHPGGGLAFRVEEDGVAIAYVTDNELAPPGAVHTSYDEWVAFCRGLDLLIHDAQYQETDMPHKHGWGHSLISQVRQLALDAEVGTLALFHHDPERSDVELEQIQHESEHVFRQKKALGQVVTTWEGMELDVSRSKSPGGRTRVRVL